MLSAGNFEQLKKMCHTKICFLTQIFKLKTEIDMHKNMVVKSFNKKVLNFKKA